MKVNRHSSRNKKIVITTLTLGTALILVTPALALWSISNESTFKREEDLDFKEYDETETFYDVEFYRTIVEAGEIDGGTTTDYTITDEDSYNQFLGFIEDYSIYIDYDDTDYYKKESHTYLLFFTYYSYTYYQNKLTSTQMLVNSEGEEVPRATLTITTNVVYTESHSTTSASYTGAYTLTVYTMSDASQTTDTTSYGSMQVRAGEIITSRMFSTFLEKMTEDYYFSSLIYTDSEFTDYFYLNETPVTENLTLYVLFYQNSPSSMGISTLTSAMETNSGTLQASNAENYEHFQIQDDPSYNSSTNTIYLGYGNKIAVAPSDSTLNLCLTDTNVYTTMPYVDSDHANYVVNEEYEYKTCDYTVKLCGDIVLDGTLTVGAELGSQFNAGVQGNINTHYVKLDLCGHTITINNGGALYCYGVICDTIGNGLVLVNGGGVFETPIVVHDYRAGGATIGAYDFDVSPFFNYVFPYVQVPVQFNYDEVYGWGELKTYFYFHPFGSGGDTMTQMELELNIIGPTSDCLFTLDKTDDSNAYALYTFTKASVDSTLSDTSNTYLYGYDRHNNFRFYNVDVSLNYFTIKIVAMYGLVNLEMKSNQFDFPVSPFFSVFIYNSVFRTNSRVCFLKGSSLYLDKDSSLILGYQTIDRGYFKYAMTTPTTESVAVSGRIFFMDVAMNTYNNLTDTIYKNDRMNVYTASQPDNYIYNNKAYFKYAQSSFKIDGNLLFVEGNTSATPYSISGYCDINNVGIIDSNDNILISSNFNSADTTETNPFTTLDYYIDTTSDVDVYYQTYDFDGINGAYYYTSTDYRASACKDYMSLRRGRSLPLISSGKAYSMSNTHDNKDTDTLYSPNVVGTYDSTTNLFTDNDGNRYFYYIDGYPYLEDSSSRGYVYNHDTQLKQCDYNNHIVSVSIDGETKYFVYFSSCYLPYDSDAKKVNIQRLVSKYVPSSGGGNATLEVSVSWSDSYNSWVR